MCGWHRRMAWSARLFVGERSVDVKEIPDGEVDGI